MVGVLVADDQVAFRRTVRSILRATSGFELVGEAVSGEQALDLVRELRPDLVLMDVRMPGMGGVEATRRITAAARETLVVLVSSYEEQDLPAAAWECGAGAYVPKANLGRRVLEELWSTHRASPSPPTRTAAPP